jgi:circadian clock protein KaiB
MTAASGETGDLDRAVLERYSLHLYVAGSTARSMLAVKNIRRLCERYLAGNYDLEVIDIYVHPEAAAKAQIIAAPTLVKLTPGPRRRAIGDLSNEGRVLAALNLHGDAIDGS